MEFRRLLSRTGARFLLGALIVAATAVLSMLGDADLANVDPSASTANESGGAGWPQRPDDARPPSAERPRLAGARVLRVIDGDTLHARHDGRDWKVRLLGIDTPETSKTRSGYVECGGAEATIAAKDLMRRWPEVTLETDPRQDRTDRFGRLLAYVVPDGSPATTYQQELLRLGWADVYVFDKQRPFGRLADFESARRAAQRSRSGAWTLCGGNFRRPLHR